MMTPPVSRIFFDIGFDLVEGSDFQEHLHHACIGTTVQRTGKRSDSGTDGSIHMGPGRGNRSGRKGRRIEGVFGMQHQTDIEVIRQFFVRDFSVQHIEKISGKTQVRFGPG